MDRHNKPLSLRKPWYQVVLRTLLPWGCTVLGLVAGVVVGYWGAVAWYAGQQENGGYYGAITEAYATLMAWCAGGGMIGAALGWLVGSALARRSSNPRPERWDRPQPLGSALPSDDATRGATMKPPSVTKPGE